DVSPTQCEHGECDNASGMRERSSTEANRIGVVAFPVASGHFGHRSPGKVGDADTARWSGRSAGGNEAHHSVEIAVGIRPVEIVLSLCVSQFHERCE